MTAVPRGVFPPVTSARTTLAVRRRNADDIAPVHSSVRPRLRGR